MRPLWPRSSARTPKFRATRTAATMTSRRRRDAGALGGESCHEIQNARRRHAFTLRRLCGARNVRRPSKGSSRGGRRLAILAKYAEGMFAEAHAADAPFAGVDPGRALLPSIAPGHPPLSPSTPSASDPARTSSLSSSFLCCPLLTGRPTPRPRCRPPRRRRRVQAHRRRRRRRRRARRSSSPGSRPAQRQRRRRLTQALQEERLPARCQEEAPGS